LISLSSKKSSTLVIRDELLVPIFIPKLTGLCAKVEVKNISRKKEKTTLLMIQIF
jgi:hypothetical protein